MNKFKKFFDNIDFHTFVEYFKTVFFSLLIALVIVITLMLTVRHNVYEAKTRDIKETSTITYYLLNLLIDKNKYLEESYPFNYRINYRLGILYEIKQQYDLSEEEFKKSIVNAPYGEYYPAYRLARLYCKTNRLTDAQLLIDNITDKSDKKLIKYKAQIYEQIAEKYFDAENYEDAVKKYEEALFYYKNIKSSNKERILNSIVSAKIYQAEDYVAALKTDEAIELLEEALKLKDSPLTQYRLGLLLTQTQPDKSIEYFEKVYKTTPELINFDDYVTFLKNTAAQKEAAGDSATAKLYKFRAERSEKFADNNLLYLENIEIREYEETVSKKSLKFKNILEISLRIKNISRKPISKLYIEVVVNDVGFSKTEIREIANPDEPIETGTFSESAKFNFKERITKHNKLSENFDVLIYAYKNPKYKIQVAELKTPKAK